MKKYLSIVVLAFLFPGTASAAIAFDAVSTKAAGTCLGGSATNLSHTITGTNPALVVAVFKSSNIDTTSVTWGSQTMTDLGTTFDTGATTVSFFYLSAPATGADTVAVTEFSADNCVIVAMSFTGVNQTEAKDVSTNTAANGSAATSASLGITTTVANAWVVDAIVKGGTATTLTPGAGQTKAASTTVGNTLRSVATSYMGPVITAGATTTSWTWGGASVFYSQFSIALVPAIVPARTLISTTATSTLIGGLTINGGCFAISNTCLTLSSFAGILGTSNGGTGTSTWQTGSIPYFDGTRFTEKNANLFWTNASNRLTVTNASTSAFSCLATGGNCGFGSTATSSFNSAGVLTLASALTVANGGTGATTLNDLITLATHTIGNFIATIAGTVDQITVAGSGSENAAVTLSIPDPFRIGQASTTLFTSSEAWPGLSHINDGTLSVPAISFSNDPDTGFYRIANNTLSWVAGGNDVVKINSTEMIGGTGNTGAYLLPRAAGTESLPAFAFVVDEDTGMYRIAANTLGFSTAGVERLRISSSGQVGIGTSTPGFLTDWYSIATTSIRIDSNSVTQGSCIIMKDTDGVGYTYVTASNGVLSGSITSCL